MDPSITYQLVRILVETGDETHLDTINQIRNLLVDSIEASRNFLEPIHQMKMKSKRIKYVFDDALATPALTPERFDEICLVIEELAPIFATAAELSSPMTDKILNNWQTMAEIVQNQPILIEVLPNVAIFGFGLSVEVLELKLTMIHLATAVQLASQAFRQKGPETYNREVLTTLNFGNCFSDTSASLYDAVKGWLETLEEELRQIDELVLK